LIGGEASLPEESNVNLALGLRLLRVVWLSIVTAIVISLGVMDLQIGLKGRPR